MPRHPLQLLLVVALTVTALACASRAVAPPPTVTPAGDEELSRIAAAVAKALTSKPVPSGVRLIGVERRRDGSITLDFSDELLIDPSDEDLTEIVQHILTAAASARSATGTQDIVILVDGGLLESYRSSQ
jgi:hypothetical protein